jgi:dipeptidyl aminopeptidase/acylaminoacyl peptidase
VNIKTITSLLFIVFIGIIFVVILQFAREITESTPPPPVGTPGIYTTFITDNSTATPRTDRTVTPIPRIQDCFTLPTPQAGFFVFRIWTKDADKELFRADIDGNNFCQLTRNEVADDQPSISPDGSLIAFVSFDEHLQLGIYLMNIDGTDRMRLAGGGTAYSFPAWSPDGQQLVFQATINELFDLYIINSDGTGLRKLTNDMSLDTQPEWSPDGQQIAFISDRTFDPEGFVRQGASYEIYVMNSDASNIRRLTNNEQLDRSPVWSPDGQQIAFVSNSNLYLMNSDGTDLRQITDSDDFFANSSALFLEGQELGFLYDHSLATYTINIETRNVQPFVVSGEEIDMWLP